MAVRHITKTAGVTTDAIGAHVIDPPISLAMTSSHPLLAGVSPSSIGMAHAAVIPDWSPESADDMKGLLPGVGTSRVLRRGARVRRLMLPKAGDASDRVRRDFLSITTPASLALLAGLISRNENLFKGGMALAGFSLAGAGLAGLTRGRTAIEQFKAESRPGILSWIVPGLGAYDHFKRLGYSTRMDLMDSVSKAGKRTSGEEGTVSKTAAATGDAVSAAVWARLFPPSVLGGAAGLAQPDDGDKELPDDALSWLPGVGAARTVRRLRRVRKELVPESRFQRSRILADILAPIATIAAGNYAGRRIGEAANTMYPEEGGSIGAAAGTLLAAAPVVAGAIVAGFTPRRTHKEQQTAERAPFSRSLIPGVGTYDLFKRLGYSKTYDEAADRRRMEKDLAWLMEHRKKTRQYTGPGV